MTITLQQCATTELGHPFRGSVEEKKGSGIRVIRFKDAYQDQDIQWETLIEAEPTTKTQPKWLQSNDILVTARNTVNYAVWLKNVAPQTLCSPHFYIVRTTHNGLLPEFLCWQLNQANSRRYFARHAVGSVTQSISRTTLDNTPIVLPSLAKQEHIIRLNRNIQQQKQRYQQLIHNADKFMHSIGSKMIQEN